MPQTVAIQMPLPDDLCGFRLPPGVNARLQELLDKQDRGERLAPKERLEAEGLVNLAEFLTILRLRSEKPQQTKVKQR